MDNDSNNINTFISNPECSKTNILADLLKSAVGPDETSGQV